MWVKFSEDKVKNVNISEFLNDRSDPFFFQKKFFWQEIVLLLMVFVDVLYRINKSSYDSKRTVKFVIKLNQILKITFTRTVFEIKNDVAVKFEVKENFFLDF